MGQFSHVKVWIFDLDDTLYAPEAFSAHMTHTIRTTLARHLGLTMEECSAYCQKLIKTHGGAPFTGLHREAAVDMDSFISEGFDLDTSLLKSCLQTKDALMSLKGRKVVFTNSPSCHAGKVLTALDYVDIFEKIFDVTMFDFDSKPNLAPYDFVLKSLGVAGTECVMVEDSLKNLKTAKGLGITTVYVHGDKPDTEGVADYIYDNVLDFLHDAIKD
tara:strand:+ start:267851 stop:268498 length:648 start_codon:yes stop_codon:yes gene_type:complete